MDEDINPDGIMSIPPIKIPLYSDMEISVKCGKCGEKTSVVFNIPIQEDDK